MGTRWQYSPSTMSWDWRLEQYLCVSHTHTHSHFHKYTYSQQNLLKVRLEHVGLSFLNDSLPSWYYLVGFQNFPVWLEQVLWPITDFGLHSRWRRWPPAILSRCSDSLIVLGENAPRCPGNVPSVGSSNSLDAETWLTQRYHLSVPSLVLIITTEHTGPIWQKNT